MTVKEIVKQWLTEHGYDGLASDYCGCEIKDLMACSSEAALRCVPAKKVRCNECKEDAESCECAYRDEGWCMKAEQ